MYKEKTLYMINLYKKDKNINIIKDFFAQLAQVDCLDIFPIINAISSHHTDLSKLIHHCIQSKPWIYQIGLEDIRNVVVFILWKDYKIMCTVEDYIPDDPSLTHLIKPSNGFTDNLIRLLETCFYIKQIYFIKNLDLSQDWERFLPWVKSYYLRNGLKETIRELAHLVVPLH